MVFIAKWCIEHALRIIFIITAVYAFIDANTRLARYHSVSRDVQSNSWRRRFPIIFRAALLILLWICTLHYVLREDHLHLPLTYRLPSIPLTSACNTLWAAFAVDTTAKFSAMLIKCLVILRLFY